MKVFLIITLTAMLLSCGVNREKSLEFYIKGKDAYSKKELNSAESSFKQSLEEDSSFLNAHLMLSKIYYYQKIYDRAINHLDSILEIDPDHSAALYWKARTLIMKNPQSNNDTEAIVCLQKILEIDSHHILARSLLALLYEKHNNYKDAIYEYTRILEEQELLINSRANLGILYKRIGLHDKSIKELNNAIEMAKLAGVSYKNISMIKQEIEK